MTQADITQHRDLVISQYRGATRLRALIDGLLKITQDELIEPLCEIETQLSLDTAEGYWLDLIGLRLGLSRPNRLPEGIRFFGFGKGDDRTSFDLAPFDGLRTLEILIPIGDNWYRSMLKGRALMLRSGSSIPDIEAICAVIFTGVFVEDVQAVMVHATDDRRGFVSLVREANLIPRPGGVELVIQEN